MSGALYVQLYVSVSLSFYSEIICYGVLTESINLRVMKYICLHRYLSMNMNWKSVV